MSLILPKQQKQNFSSLIVSDLTFWKLCLKLINLEIVLEATRIDPRGVGKPVHKRHNSTKYFLLFMGKGAVRKICPFLLFLANKISLKKMYSKMCTKTVLSYCIRRGFSSLSFFNFDL